MQIDALTTAGTHPVAQSSLAPAMPRVGAGTVGDSPERPETSLPASGHPIAPWPETPLSQKMLMTAEMMQNELMSMGVEPTTNNVVVAQSLAKLAIPVTPQTMAEAHASLAAAGATVLPPSFALAKALGLPPSPAVLRGLSTVMASSATVAQTHGSVFSLLQSVLPAALAPEVSMPIDAVIETADVTLRQQLPLELLQRLGLTVDFNATPAEIATKMMAYSRQVLRSTENRIAQALSQGGSVGEINDLRTMLLRLASTSADPEIRDGATALASHIEGQQLINSGANQPMQHIDGQSIAYVALPLVLAGEQAMVEMRLWPRNQEHAENWTDEDAYPMRATVRLTLHPIGRVQADVVGDLTGYLNCRLSAENPAGLQMINQNADQLSNALAHAGWPKSEINCGARVDWSPLWTGGEALVKPRQRIDWRA